MRLARNPGVDMHCWLQKLQGILCCQEGHGRRLAKMFAPGRAVRAGDALQHGRTVGAPRPTFDALMKRSVGQVFGEETEGHEFPIS